VFDFFFILFDFLDFSFFRWIYWKWHFLYQLFDSFLDLIQFFFFEASVVITLSTLIEGEGNKIKSNQEKQ